MMLSSNSKIGGVTPIVTQEGVLALSRRILAQNTLVFPDFLGKIGSIETVAVFETNDPDSPTHWLTQFRMKMQVSPPSFPFF